MIAEAFARLPGLRPIGVRPLTGPTTVLEAAATTPTKLLTKCVDNLVDNLIKYRACPAKLDFIFRLPQYWASSELESPMATHPTSEQCAREILAVFIAHYGLRPGEVLRRNSFLTLWPQRGYRPKDFKAGLQFAIESGWLELLSDGKSYRLTRSGFADG
jgi:hypothetical protein